MYGLFCFWTVTDGCCWRIYFGNARDNMYSLLYLPIVIVPNVEYIKRITNTVTHKSRYNWRNDNAILTLEYSVYILVFRCLFCLFLFNGVLLREETSRTNPLPLCSFNFQLNNAKWKVDINQNFIFNVCFSN